MTRRASEMLTFTKAELLDEHMNVISDVECEVDADVEEGYIDLSNGINFPPVMYETIAVWVRFSGCHDRRDIIMIRIADLMDTGCLEIVRHRLH
jgi:hypothetical protein